LTQTLTNYNLRVFSLISFTRRLIRADE